MARKVIWTESALSELEEILDFIFRDSRYYAAITEEQMHEAARSLIRFPYRARVVPEFEQVDIREVFVYGYRLIFKISEQQITVLMVVHSSRDLSKVLPN